MPKPARQRWRITFCRDLRPGGQGLVGRDYLASWDDALVRSALPIAETAFNTLLLLASGAVLYLAYRRFQRSQASARTPLLISILLGAGFVLLQGREWVSMLSQGLTLQSSALGSFFYLIVGFHALHAVVALGILTWTWRRLSRGSIPPTTLAAASIFWYFVVGVWPVLYWRVYLT